MMAEKETMTTQTTEKRPSLVRAKSLLDSCDFCEAQEEGGHYCLLHSCQLKNANLWTCPECRRCRHRLRTSSNSSPAPCSASITVRRGFDGWGVQFNYGVQHFDVGPQNFGMEREAEWMASMFSNALANMNAELTGSSKPEKGLN